MDKSSQPQAVLQLISFIYHFQKKNFSKDLKNTDLETSFGLLLLSWALENSDMPVVNELLIQEIFGGKTMSLVIQQNNQLFTVIPRLNAYRLRVSLGPI
jgi:hypothetical protein